MWARIMPVALLGLVACVPTLPAPPVVQPITPTASTAVPSPARDQPAVQVLERYDMLVTADGHLTPPVDTTVTLRAIARRDKRPLAGATWRLDSVDAGHATLAPSRDGATCTLTATRPGALRVTATLGMAVAPITLVATTHPAPAMLVSDPIPGVQPVSNETKVFDYPSTTVIVSDQSGWTRYWQGIMAYMAERSFRKAPTAIPPLPPVDFKTRSLVMVSASLFTTVNFPAIERVSPAGAGLLEIGLPDEDTNVNYIDNPESYLRIYQVEKVPAGAKVRYDCRSDVACSSPEPVPSADPLAHLTADILIVGQAFDLPAQLMGVPLTWSVAPRTASRATLAGTRLMPKAAGDLVLIASTGQDTAFVVDAIRANADVERPLYAQSGFPQVALGSEIRVARTQDEWKSLWATLWYPPGTGADQPWTAPPPPPPAPEVGFPERCVLAVSLKNRGQPVVTAIEGSTVRMSLTGVSRGGVFTPAGAPVGPVSFFDLPAFEGVPRVVIEAAVTDSSLLP